MRHTNKMVARYTPPAEKRALLEALSRVWLDRFGADREPWEYHTLGAESLAGKLVDLLLDLDCPIAPKLHGVLWLVDSSRKLRCLSLPKTRELGTHARGYQTLLVHRCATATLAHRKRGRVAV